MLELKYILLCALVEIYEQATWYDKIYNIPFTVSRSNKTILWILQQNKYEILSKHLSNFPTFKAIVIINV